MDDLLRLAGFKCTSDGILGKEHKRAARALGAINKSNQLGRLAVVIEKLTIIFQCAVEARDCYPTIKLEKSFWEIVLDDITKRKPPW